MHKIIIMKVTKNFLDIKESLPSDIEKTSEMIIKNPKEGIYKYLSAIGDTSIILGKPDTGKIFINNQR